jgi:hypothetical protein
MAGFFPFGLPFGTSNRSNAGTPPTVQVAGNSGEQQQQNNGYQPANTQLQQKNSNHVPQNSGTNIDPSTDPKNNADPTKGQSEGSHLDNFADIFKMPVDDKGQAPVDPLAQPLITVDQKALGEIAGKMNFTSTITPEQLNKVLQERDPQALLDMMNSVGQRAFMAASLATMNVTETAFKKNNERFDQALPDRIRTHQVQNSSPKHSALNHPNAKPMVEALKSQIALANPQLSPERVTDMAENYFVSLAKDISAVDNKQIAANKPSTEPDYSSFLPENLR